MMAQILGHNGTVEDEKVNNVLAEMRIQNTVTKWLEHNGSIEDVKNLISKIWLS
jgi:hypothetical protein